MMPCILCIFFVPRSNLRSVAGELRKEPLWLQHTRPDTFVVAPEIKTTAVEIVPPRQTTRDVAALETGMAALAHALDQPIALEFAGTSNSRHFIARASNTSALDQLVRQIQARYPQAVVRPLMRGADPLRLEPGEAVTALELRPGAGAYLPLRTLDERELAQPGADSLLGLLAAFGAVSQGHRAVAQLALVPAHDLWSAPYQRLAVEHPLEPERARERWEMANVRMDLATGSGGLSLPAMLGLLTLLGVVVLVWRNATRFPFWLRQAVAALLHQHPVHLTAAQSLWLTAWGIGIFVCLCLMLLAIAWLRAWLRNLVHRTHLYDQRLVQEKTTRIAYRARLRLVAIGPAHSLPAAKPNRASSARFGIRRSWRAGLDAVFEGKRAALRRTFPMRIIRSLRAAPSGARARHAGQYLRLVWRRWEAIQRAAHARRVEVKTQARLRRETLEGFVGAYRQFHLATGGYFTPRWLPSRAARRLVQPSRRSWCGRMTAGGWRHGVRRSPHLLSVADIAALWHLPQAEDLADLPLVERTRARTLLVPDGLAHPAAGFRIGTSTHAGHTLPVCLPADATRRNALAIAKTGKGKSTLLLGLARAVLAEQEGLVLIDPHGDLAETVLAHTPERRRDDTLLVDLGDREYPIGLNLLDSTLFPDRDKAVSNMIAVFSQIWKNFWGPRMESALEAALKTLYEANQAEVARDRQDGPDRQYTLLDATPLLTFPAFRHRLMAQVRDPALTEYWTRFEALQPRLQQDIITPVTTKLDKFANSFVARRIVGQGRSTLNLAAAIRRGEVVLVKTARGVVGHDTAALIGATLLGLLQVTLGEQANLTTGARGRVRVFVDEFQLLEGVDFGAMLAELRKFGASFALATQALAHLDALDKTLRPTVLANVDQLFCYAMSAEDARMLERELDGVVETTDLIALDDFSCYARLTVGGRRIPVFSLMLDPPASLDEAQRTQAEALRQRSQRRLGRAVDMVDTLIAQAALRRMAVTEPQLKQPGMAGWQQEDGQQRDTQSDIGRRALTMKTNDSMQASAADGRTGTSVEQAPQAAAQDGEKRGRTRSHWKRGKGGKRRPNEPPFTSLLLSRTDADDVDDVDDVDDADGADDMEAEGNQEVDEGKDEDVEGPS